MKGQLDRLMEIIEMVMQVNYLLNTSISWIYGCFYS